MQSQPESPALGRIIFACSALRLPGEGKIVQDQPWFVPVATLVCEFSVERAGNSTGSQKPTQRRQSFSPSSFPVVLGLGGRFGGK